MGQSCLMKTIELPDQGPMTIRPFKLIKIIGIRSDNNEKWLALQGEDQLLLPHQPPALSHPQK